MKENKSIQDGNNEVFKKEKQEISQYLESKIQKLDSNQESKKDLQSLLAEVKSANSINELDEVLKRFESLDTIKDQEITEFLRIRIKKDLTDLQKTIPIKKSTVKIEDLNPDQLKQLADKWRKNSANNIRTDLNEIDAVFWGKGPVSWIIKKANA